MRCRRRWRDKSRHTRVKNNYHRRITVPGECLAPQLTAKTRILDKRRRYTSNTRPEEDAMIEGETVRAGQCVCVCVKEKEREAIVGICQPPPTPATPLHCSTHIYCTYILYINIGLNNIYIYIHSIHSIHKCLVRVCTYIYIYTGRVYNSAADEIASSAVCELLRSALSALLCRRRKGCNRREASERR